MTRSLDDLADDIVLATMSEGMVIQRTTGEIVRCNAAAESILGLTADQMAGLTSADPHWEARREDGTPWPGDTHPTMLAIHHGLRTQNAIMQVRHGDGSVRWISINASPIDEVGDSGEPVVLGAVATFRDITAEREAADRAAENQRQLVEALLASDLPVAVSDGDGRLTGANEAYAAMVGRPSTELAGMHFSEFSGQDHLGEQLVAVGQIRAGLRDQFHTAKTYVRPDGGIRHGLMNLIALRDDAGEVVRHISIVHDVTDQVAAADRWRDQAMVDELTGVMNRRAACHVLDGLLGSGGDRPLLVAFVDVDDFKTVNDVNGHAAGDAVLTAVAEALRGVVRATDVVGRWGGDEFVVIFPDAPPSAADRLAGAIDDAVNAIGPVGERHGGELSVSVGIAAAEPGDDRASLLDRADQRMYRLKQRRTPPS